MINTTSMLEKYSNVSPLVLSSQVRYNNRIRIKDEDLAQHSYYVAYNIMSLGHDFDIDDVTIGTAVCRAIVHDLDEQFTSDIPHDCKVEFPELKEMVRTIGLTYIKNRADFATKHFEDYITNKDLATMLVDTADAISVLQYSNRELLLGNKTEEMKNIFGYTECRVIKLLNELKAYMGK